MYIFTRRNWLADFRFEGIECPQKVGQKKKKRFFRLKLIADDKRLNIYNS